MGEMGAVGENKYLRQRGERGRLLPGSRLYKKKENVTCGKEWAVIQKTRKCERCGKEWAVTYGKNGV